MVLDKIDGPVVPFNPHLQGSGGKVQNKSTNMNVKWVGKKREDLGSSAILLP